MASKFKLNEKAKVVNNTCCHKFIIGDIVTIVQIIPSPYCDGGYYYKAKDAVENIWSLDSYDLEKVKSITL